MKPVIIVSTYPDKSSISKIANQLVESKIAACVNISEISSIYSWDGKVENSSECMGFFKTSEKNKEILKEKIKETHPYNVPEIAEIDVTSINKSYYDWIVKSTS